MRFLRLLIQHVAARDTATPAAAMAFYSLFALAPVGYFIVAACGWALGDLSARRSVTGFLAGYLGDDRAAAMVGVVAKDPGFAEGAIGWVLSVGMVLYAASASTFQLRQTLSEVFGATRASGWSDWLRSTLVGRVLATVFAVAFGLGVVVLVVGTAAAGQLARASALGPTLAGPVGWLVLSVGSWLAITLMFALVMKGLPSQAPPWPAVLGGAACAAALFELGKNLIAGYLARSEVASAYGPAGALVALLLWLYYSAQIFLLGAEVAAALHGSRPAAGPLSHHQAGPS